MRRLHTIHSLPRIHICCKTEKTRETVKQYLIDQEIFNFVENEGPGVQLSVGEISEGFEMEDEKVVYINESEIFKEKRVSQRKKKHKGRKIDSFAELHVGDYVVHDVHGIGIYRGNAYLLPLDTVPMITYSKGFYKMSEMPKSTALIQVILVILMAVWFPLAGSIVGFI